MPKKRQKTSHNPNNSVNNPANVCKLCLSDSDDEVLYGPKFSIEPGTVHYFCILFACGLTQNGEDEEGAFGFLAEDIRKEILRANKLKCTFCKRNTVASACAVSHCRVKYHFNCGLKNNCLFNFFGCFESFCIKHRPPLDKRYSTVDPELNCSICLEKLGNRGEQNAQELKYQILLTSCCSKFLHINCVKAQAHNAGMHFIKCPLCNDRDNFINCAKSHGVYLPDQDARWEDPNDPHLIRLSERYAKCDASICRCAEGRNYCADNSEWEINVCQTCGSFGMHTACSDELVNELDDSDFECPDCKELSRRKFESINRNEPEITMEEPEMKINEPMIAICEPPDDSQRSAPIESKSRTIELIELSSDEEEEEDGIICMNVCRQLASSNLGLPKSNGHLGKMSNC